MTTAQLDMLDRFGRKDEEMEPTKDQIEAAARKLVAALDACRQHIDGAFGFAAIHGANYNGPTYGKELDALREVLAAPHLAGTQAESAEPPAQPDGLH